MPDDTITLVLNGEVFAEDLAAAVGGWTDVLKGIANEVAGAENLRWVVDDASGGSFTTTFKAAQRTVEQPEKITEVVHRFTRFTRDFRTNSIGGYSPLIRGGAQRIAQVLGDRVTSVRFETDEADAEISAEVASTSISQPQVSLVQPPRVQVDRRSYGAVRGRVQSITNRQSLRFTLYEVASDRAVSCYVQPGHEDVMREAWGKLSLVEGIVRRDPQTGHPMTIREVKNITVLPIGKRGGWREALRCAPSRPGEISPEAAIRRLRDAE